jgi:hypothetical protein
MAFIRRLNEEGLQRLGSFLDSLKGDQPEAYPAAVLTDPATSEPIESEVAIEPRRFGNRFEAAKYLFEKLSAAGIRDVERDGGMWAWLALFYFEELCPAGSDGQRKPGERARWIPEVSNFQRYYRHLLAGPYIIYRAHRESPPRAMALLCNPLDRPGDIVEQFASRQELVTNRAIVEGATKLYIDPRTSRPRRGSGGKGDGSPRRFADVLKQFDATWDLYALTTEALLHLLPTEFDRFRPAAAEAVVAQ